MNVHDYGVSSVVNTRLMIESFSPSLSDRADARSKVSIKR